MTSPGRDELPFDDVTDFENADRGFLVAFGPAVVEAEDGRAVWDSEAYGFLDGECPGTAHPSLWRQARLCARQGLYEVTEGVYQVRGLDLSNMTIVEGGRGVIVVDPLISAETAAAALALYRGHRGDRPVTGLICTLARRPLRRRPRSAAARHRGGRPGDRAGGLPGARGQRERLRGQRHGPPRRLHVRRQPARPPVPIVTP